VQPFQKRETRLSKDENGMTRVNKGYVPLVKLAKAISLLT
jgi:hypothetical protein